MMLGVELIDRSANSCRIRSGKRRAAQQPGAGRAGFAFPQSVPAPGTAPGGAGLYQALRGWSMPRKVRAGPAGLRHHQTEQAQRRQPRANGQLRPGCPIMARSGGGYAMSGTWTICCASRWRTWRTSPGSPWTPLMQHPAVVDMKSYCAAADQGNHRAARIAVAVYRDTVPCSTMPSIYIFFFFPAVCRFSAQVREPASQGGGAGSTGQGGRDYADVAVPGVLAGVVARRLTNRCLRVANSAKVVL